jgi:hypothetical protein
MDLREAFMDIGLCDWVPGVGLRLLGDLDGTLSGAVPLAASSIVRVWEAFALLSAAIHRASLPSLTGVCPAIPAMCGSILRSS